MRCHTKEGTLIYIDREKVIACGFLYSPSENFGCGNGVFFDEAKSKGLQFEGFYPPQINHETVSECCTALNIRMKFRLGERILFSAPINGYWADSRESSSTTSHFFEPSKLELLTKQTSAG